MAVYAQSHLARNEVVQLVSITQTQDSKGVWHKEEKQRQVYANVKSATAKEFFEGGRNGLRPDFTISMFFYDYQNEDIVIYNGVRYAVYRTYRVQNDIIELHVQKRAGVNGKDNN